MKNDTRGKDKWTIDGNFGNQGALIRERSAAWVVVKWLIMFVEIRVSLFPRYPITPSQLHRLLQVYPELRQSDINILHSWSSKFMGREGIKDDFDCLSESFVSYWNWK